MNEDLATVTRTAHRTRTPVTPQGADGHLDRAMLELQASARAHPDTTLGDGLTAEGADPLTRWVTAGFVLSILLSVALVVELLRA